MFVGFYIFLHRQARGELLSSKYPPHDGTIMAYDIGAKVTGKEWNDGHTSRSTHPAACYDNWGDMFTQIPSTTEVEVHHDLGVPLSIWLPL